MPLGYSPDTAAAAFDPPLSRHALRRALASGALPSYRAGKSRVILADDLVNFVRNSLPLYSQQRKQKGQTHGA